MSLPHSKTENPETDTNDPLLFQSSLEEARVRHLLAAISRAVTSSRDLEETFGRFASLVAEIIPWDRIAITALEGSQGAREFVYQAGIEYERLGRNSLLFVIKDLLPNFATDPTPIIVDEQMASQSDDLRMGQDIAVSAGLRSWLLAPLIWRNEQIGHIHFRSKKPMAYDVSHAHNAQLVSNQISGAIAGNLAYDKLTKQANEREALAKISRTLAASHTISESFDQFAEIVKLLIPADRISVSRISEDGRRFFTFLEHGLPLKGLGKSKLAKSRGDITDQLRKQESPQILSDTKDRGYDLSMVIELSQASGMYSWLAAPMWWGGELIGSLHIRSVEEHAYGDRDIRLAGEISSQVSGLIASSNAYEKLEHEAKVRDVLAQISLTLSSSPELATALPRVEALTASILEFDGFSIGAYNDEKQTIRRLYAQGAFKGAQGIQNPSDQNAEFPIAQSAAAKAILERRTEIISLSSSDFIQQHPQSVEAFEGGTRTFLTTPLISSDKVVGAIQIRSMHENAYSNPDIEVLERISDQIAGALANGIANEQIRLQAAALESADNAILITSPNGTIEWVNPAFTNLVGWTASEAVGQSTSILKSTDSQNWALDENIWNALSQGKSWRGIHISRRKDGTEFPEELTATPVVDRDGVVTHIIAIKNDIADRLSAEEARRNTFRIESENRELQRVAHTRSEFLSTVSHELRTPLTTVSAFADILYNSKSENLTDRQRTHLELIRKSSSQLGSLIDDLLDISQADSGRLILNKKSFEISTMIDEVADSSRILLATREQQLSVRNLAPFLSLHADRSRVIQIVSNLLTNASKFSPPESSIKIDAEVNHDHISITITDQGSGISKPDQAMMFSPFFRGKSRDNEQPDGRGLGLAVVRSLVDLHDGSIDVVSKKGKGTTITVTLPGVTSEPADS
jgi:PAS domain S-box-containing protein